MCSLCQFVGFIVVQILIIKKGLVVYMFVGFSVHVSIFFTMMHVVIGHGGTWRPVAHCVLCSSDGHSLSCSTAHFLFSVCLHGWKAFFSLQLYEMIEMETVLFIF